MRRQSVPAVVVALATIGAVFFILPLLGLLLRAPWSEAARSLAEPETLDALRLSLVASLSATGIALVLGVPSATVLASQPHAAVQGKTTGDGSGHGNQGGNGQGNSPADLFSPWFGSSAGPA